MLCFAAGRGADGAAWRESWTERLMYASNDLDCVVERNAHKWAVQEDVSALHSSLSLQVRLLLCIHYYRCNNGYYYPKSSTVMHLCMSMFMYEYVMVCMCCVVWCCQTWLQWV